jgi:hypothetical protein
MRLLRVTNQSSCNASCHLHCGMPRPTGACHSHKESNLRSALVLIAVFATFNFPGCSSQQTYGVGQAWQRNECFKINDAQERSRCLASASTSYEEYNRKAEAAKKTQ